MYWKDENKEKEGVNGIFKKNFSWFAVKASLMLRVLALKGTTTASLFFIFIKNCFTKRSVDMKSDSNLDRQARG